MSKLWEAGQQNTLGFKPRKTKPAAHQIKNCPECEAGDGDCCSGDERTCKSRRESALDAGIPASVLDGHTKLTDHCSRETIARMAGSETQREQDEQDMIDAGRGHMVRR